MDGIQIEPAVGGLRTDKNGSVDITFKDLPKEIARGDASVSVTFTDGGNVETLVRPVPMVLSKLEVEYFPEGGDLVAGVPNRVYFQSRTTLGKPAELRGRILDETNAVACDVQTFSDPKEAGANHGMGVFTYTPIEGKKYRLVVDVPAGITEVVGAKNGKGGDVLPGVKADGIVLSVPTGVTTGKDTIRAVVRSAKEDRRILVGAYLRGRLMAHQRSRGAKGQAVEVDLRPDTEDGGVIRVTAFEERSIDGKTDLTPVAERLVYRTPARKLNLAAQAERQNYTPGERVKLVCLAANEKGEKTPAIIMVAVVDKSVLTMADEKTFRSLPTHFLLTTEVRRPEDLEHADFLVGESPKAAIALDLLLGTQGWRRFAEQNPGQFKQAFPQEADRVLVLNNDVRIDDVAARATAAKVEEVANAYAPRFTTKEAVLEKAQVKYEEIIRDDRVLRERHDLETQTQALEVEYKDAVKSAGAYGESLGRVKKVALPVFALALLLAGLFAVARGLLQQNRAQMLPYLAGAACCLALCAAVVTVPFGSESVAARAFALDAPAWADDQMALAMEPDVMPTNEAKPGDVLKEMEKAEKAANGVGDDKDARQGRGEGAGSRRPRANNKDLQNQMKQMLEKRKQADGAAMYKAIRGGPGGFGGGQVPGKVPGMMPPALPPARWRLESCSMPSTIRRERWTSCCGIGSVAVPTPTAWASPAATASWPVNPSPASRSSAAPWLRWLPDAMAGSSRWPGKQRPWPPRSSSASLPTATTARTPRSATTSAKPSTGTPCSS